MTESDPFEIAQRLLRRPDVHDVRVSRFLIVVVHAPDEPNQAKIPQSVYDAIQSEIAGTEWQPDYRDAGRDAERHSWTGGRSHRAVLPSHEQPERYELQYRLVR